MGEYSFHFDLYPPSFPLLQHKPSQENNKQMSRMGTALSKSSQALRQAGTAALVPRLEGRGQASAWMSQCPSRTRKTCQKSVTCHRHPPIYQLHTPPCTSLDTQTESKTTISTSSVRSSCPVLCTVCGFVRRNSPWMGAIVTDWTGVESPSPVAE